MRCAAHERALFTFFIQLGFIFIALPSDYLFSITKYHFLFSLIIVSISNDIYFDYFDILLLLYSACAYFYIRQLPRRRRQVIGYRPIIITIGNDYSGNNYYLTYYSRYATPHRFEIMIASATSPIIRYHLTLTYLDFTHA